MMPGRKPETASVTSVDRKQTSGLPVTQELCFFRVGYFTTRSQVKIDSTTGEVSSGVSIRSATRESPYQVYGGVALVFSQVPTEYVFYPLHDPPKICYWTQADEESQAVGLNQIGVTNAEQSWT